MDRFLTEKLIRKLETFPCLYAWKTNEYKDKPKRAWAFNAIHTDLKKFSPSLTLEQVQVKVQSLRSQYAREMRYQEKKISKGELNFRPKLWCFEQLSFLKEHSNSKKRRTDQKFSKFPSMDDDEEYTCFTEPEEKYANRQAYNDEGDVIEESEYYNIDIEDAAEDELQTERDLELADIIEEEGSAWAEHDQKVNMAEKGEQEDYHNAQMIYFQNQDRRAKEKHDWEKKHAAAKHNWTIKIHKIKYKILQAELALKLKEVNKNGKR